VDQDEVNPASMFDGGDGTGDVLVIADTSFGNWNFIGETLTGFEEIEFDAISFDFDRIASFTDTQVAGVSIFDFDGGTDSEETLRIFLTSLTTVDYSTVNVQGFSTADDSIEIAGDSSSESITGTSVADQLLGGTGSDTLNGGNGDDTLFVQQDGVVNFYNGGTGVDTLNFSIFGAAVTFFHNTLAASGTFVSGGTTSIYTGITNVIGSATDDFLRGAGIVNGGGGADSLRGFGDNTVLGGSGNDILRLSDGDGSPNFDGGADTDTFSTEDLSTNLTYVELGAGYRQGTNVAGAFSGTSTNIENFVGSSSNDIVIGTDDANLIQTNGGNDTIEGGRGNDSLYVGGGNDVFTETGIFDLLNNKVLFDGGR
jgi:Ca2+-binding RTX toxin-like protein